MKHTPGPWRTDGYFIRQDLKNVGGRMIADAGPRHTPSSEYPISCRLMDEANAQLMAASPELLEALEMLILLEPSSYDSNAYERSLWQNARDAVKKATEK